MNLDTDLIPVTIINSKRITDLNVKCKIIKLLENTGENIDETGFRNNFQDTTPKAQSIKGKNKLDCIKI